MKPRRPAAKAAAAPDFRIDDLVLLAEVRKAGSLSAVARALQSPKATVSRRLGALETAVGQRLFVPGARRLTLTDFGAQLADRAARHQEDLDETRRWIGAQGAVPSGRLRLSVPADFAILLMAEPMARFVQRYPQVTLEVDTAPRRVDLIQDGIDLAIRIGPLEDSPLVARRLMLLERGMYASPVYLADRAAPRRPEDLRDHAFVLLQQALSLPAQLRRGRRAVEVEMKGALQCNSIGLVRALGLAGGGIASLPHGMARADVLAGRLVAVLPDWGFDPLPVSIVAAGRRLMPAKVRAFIDHLAETAPGWAL